MTVYTEDELRRALAREADAAPPVLAVWPQLHHRIVVRRWARAGVAATAAGVAATALIVALPDGRDAVRVPPARGAGPTTLVPERPLSNAELTTSADVLRQRIDALGIDGAEISTHDGTITLTAPRISSGEVIGLAARGVLQLRPVDAMEAPSACPAPASAVPATHGAVACSSDGSVEYTLGPVALGNDDVQSAHAALDATTNQWIVQVRFDHAGAQKYLTLTADAASKPFPETNCGPPKGCNAIAILVDGTVLAAPSVQQPGGGGIPGGQTQITGTASKSSAEILAAIVAAPPLPAAFSVDATGA